MKPPLSQTMHLGKVLILVAWLLTLAIRPGFSAPETNRYDLVIYGGTAGGIFSAVSASRAGATVVVLEPSGHVGGMVTGGLGQTDLGVAASIGGMAAEFYRRIKRHYVEQGSR
jgi:ribulose 1,5-bisphosphate synthetase/thiazole synthase